MKTRLEVQEKYRIDTEEEVQAAISEEKALADVSGYELIGYSSKLKTKKDGRSGYEVTFKKEFFKFWDVDGEE